MKKVLSSLVKNKKDSQWTIFTNHGRVLILLSLTPDITIRELSSVTGITERAIQRILADLQETSYITVVKQGRNNSYILNLNQNFRHPVESHVKIKSMISAINKKDKK